MLGLLAYVLYLTKKLPTYPYQIGQFIKSFVRFSWVLLFSLLNFILQGFILFFDWEGGVVAPAELKLAV